ncbi:hypothetical protein FHW96_002983 [Novosphingobium sp. SG751A]|uniref:hypothetical protein n=1 Tax=Novosphingobium sp. SG751A TaxID=2587000 RepID=UPI0015542CEE|nr:hypothetical protein [Novosphingobium sp. SG751A]NOW46819.1 hypothetical protein [Novosphingobium sp. SG751A]
MNESNALTDENIEAIARGMVERRLPKEQWTHDAHWAAALWLLRYHPEIAEPQAMGAAIRAYNESVGGVNDDTSGYHETITIASLRAARAEIARYESDTPLSQILTALLAGDLGKSDWPMAYWRRETLFSVAARREWVAPDLGELPF